MNSESGHTFKQTVWLVLGAVFLFWGLNHYNLIFHFIGILWGYLFPVILGIGIAFLLNILMRFIEKKLFKLCEKMKMHPSLKIIRPTSLILTTLIFTAVALGTVIIAIPQIADTFISIKEQIPRFFDQYQRFLNQFSSEMPKISSVLSDFSFDISNISAKLTSMIGKLGELLLSSSLSFATSMFGGISNFFFALIFAFYILMSKESLCRQLDTVSNTFLPRKYYLKTREFLQLVDDTFSGFFSGQCLVALLTGLLFFIGMRIFSFPYATLVSVLVGVLSFVPIIGAFISLVIGALLIFVQSPIKALWFILFFLVIQQIEGNFIYPRIVSTSIGLPAIWVLVAVMLGGAIMGVFGVIIFIPCISVLYTLFKRFVYEKSNEKGAANELETRN